MSSVYSCCNGGMRGKRGRVLEWVRGPKIGQLTLSKRPTRLGIHNVVQEPTIPSKGFFFYIKKLQYHVQHYNVCVQYAKKISLTLPVKNKPREWRNRTCVYSWLNGQNGLQTSTQASIWFTGCIRPSLQAIDEDDLVPWPDSDGKGAGSPAQDSVGAIIGALERGDDAASAQPDEGDTEEIRWQQVTQIMLARERKSRSIQIFQNIFRNVVNRSFFSIQKLEGVFAGHGPVAPSSPLHIDCYHFQSTLVLCRTILLKYSFFEKSAKNMQKLFQCLINTRSFYFTGLYSNKYT